MEKSFLIMEMHTLLITNYRLIMAKLSKELWKQIAQEKKDKVENKGGDWLKKMWTTVTALIIVKE